MASFSHAHTTQSFQHEVSNQNCYVQVLNWKFFSSYFFKSQQGNLTCFSTDEVHRKDGFVKRKLIDYICCGEYLDFRRLRSWHHQCFPWEKQATRLWGVNRVNALNISFSLLKAKFFFFFIISMVDYVTLWRSLVNEIRTSNFNNFTGIKWFNILLVIKHVSPWGHLQ